MQRMKSKKGFTMAEVLIVVAIIGVLAGVAFISVTRYLRSMTKLEYDNYAKSIFVAAQNHLTMAAHEGYLGKDGYGEADSESGVYYLVVQDGSEIDASDSSVLPLILPDGSIDGTVLADSYIVRYHKDSGQVLDVFFWSTSGENGRFAHNYDSDYSNFLSNKTNKSKLTKWDDDSVIGYYGGVEADDFETWTKGKELVAPSVIVKNAETLSVTVKDNNPTDVTDVVLQLIIKGDKSGAIKAITLDKANLSGRVISYDATTKQFLVVLDDITNDGRQFKDFESDDQVNTPFIPGENLLIHAVTFSNSSEYISNIAYSTEQKTNSLFAKINDGFDTASIENIRHLENLNDTLSAVSYGAKAADVIKITKAEQTTDLSWAEFKSNVNEFYRALATTPQINGTSTSGSFLPISPSYAIDYDGKNHSITGIAVTGEANAGLFGSVSGGNIHDLELVDFSISGTTTAGALAGTLTSCTVNNVLARNSSNQASDDTRKISVSGGNKGNNAGGLVGSASSSTIKYSAASLIVSSTGGNAGGLIGEASGGTITGCYSGGHTSGAMYSNSDYNVTASGSAGGLVGTSTTTITYSYSTCSVTGATAGGFIGTASDDSSNSNCYCTGLVDGTPEGAFAGSFSGATASNCNYFRVINLEMSAVGGSSTPTGIEALDKTTTDYSRFVKSGTYQKDAKPYDATLLGYYNGKYNLKTVEQLGALGITGTMFVSKHYGDWPAPEIFFINTPDPNVTTNPPAVQDPDPDPNT